MKKPLDNLKSEIERISNVLETELNEYSIINEDNIYSKYIKYSIQIKDTGIMNSEYFKTEQEANDYATKIRLKEDEYSLIQWIKEPVYHYNE